MDPTRRTAKGSSATSSCCGDDDGEERTSHDVRREECEDQEESSVNMAAYWEDYFDDDSTQGSRRSRPRHTTSFEQAEQLHQQVQTNKNRLQPKEHKSPSLSPVPMGQPQPQQPSHHHPNPNPNPLSFPSLRPNTASAKNRNTTTTTTTTTAPHSSVASAARQQMPKEVHSSSVRGSPSSRVDNLQNQPNAGVLNDNQHPDPESMDKGSSGSNSHTASHTECQAPQPGAFSVQGPQLHEQASSVSFCSTDAVSSSTDIISSSNNNNNPSMTINQEQQQLSTSEEQEQQQLRIMDDIQVMAVAQAVTVDDMDEEMEMERACLSQKQQQLAQQEALLRERESKLKTWEEELERKQQAVNNAPPVVQAAHVFIVKDDAASGYASACDDDDDDEDDALTRPGAPTRSWSLFSRKSTGSVASSNGKRQRRQQQQRQQQELRQQQPRRRERRPSFDRSGGNASASSLLLLDAAESCYESQQGSYSNISSSIDDRDDAPRHIITTNTTNNNIMSTYHASSGSLLSISNRSVDDNSGGGGGCGGGGTDQSALMELSEVSTCRSVGDSGSKCNSRTATTCASTPTRSVDLASLAQMELGPGPLRFEPSPNDPNYLTMEEQIAILSSSDRRVVRNLRQKWNDKQDKLVAKYGLESSKTMPELTIEWYLRFCFSNTKKFKRYYVDGSHYYESRFSEDRAWASLKKLEKRFLFLTAFDLASQLETKTLFPVPGLKTTDGLDMFYMRPARYFPNITSVRSIIDNLCYVMNTMLENNPHAQSQGVGFIACMDDWKMKNFDVTYCYQFMMALQGFMVPVKTKLFLIVNPPRWFGAIWKIMKPMLLPAFRRLVKIVPESKIYKYLQEGYEQSLPDDMRTGMADTNAMVQDFIAYRKFVESDYLLQRNIHGGTTASGSYRPSDTTSHHSGEGYEVDGRLDCNRSVAGLSSNQSDAGSRISVCDLDDDDGDDDASIHCDIHDEAELDEEDMKQPATGTTREIECN